MRRLLIALLVAFGSQAALAQAGLFERPVHITREVSDSISGATAIVEEYMAGSRVISIRGDRTTIADYAEGRLTEIDQAAGTFSVTTFDAIARANAATALRSARRERVAPPAVEDAGSDVVAGQSVRRFRAEVAGSSGESASISVSVSDTLRVSRDALDVILGVAWPGEPNEVTAVAVEAARRVVPDSQARSAAAYGLPLEQSVTWVVAGEEVRSVNRVLRVGNELPPPDLVAIPHGAREVVSPIVERSRLLEELDRLPSEGTRP